jgi:anti-sigma-K factor RskA
MPRSTPYLAILRSIIVATAAFAAGACGSDNIFNPTPGPAPTSVTESFTATITVNGASVQPFTVSTIGTVTAKLSALSPDDTVTVGLSLGTWNGAACALTITNDAAMLNTTVTGTAQTVGQFCARVYDVGKLTAATDYTIDITHF